MHSHVAILSPTSIPLSIWVELDRVDWTKMTLHTSKLFLEYHVEEPGLELAHPGASGGDVHGVLSAPKHHMVVQRTEQLQI